MLLNFSRNMLTSLTGNNYSCIFKSYWHCPEKWSYRFNGSSNQRMRMKRTRRRRRRRWELGGFWRLLLLAGASIWPELSWPRIWGVGRRRERRRRRQPSWWWETATHQQQQQGGDLTLFILFECVWGTEVSDQTRTCNRSHHERKTLPRAKSHEPSLLWQFQCPWQFSFLRFLRDGLGVNNMDSIICTQNPGIAKIGLTSWPPTP